ncbi:hypothetical protein OROGR_014180 [Orobanche gracilis]
METPSSSRRVTRSQTLAASANNSNIILSKKVEESEKTMMKSRKKSGQKQKQQQQDRSALVDITNDSPIVGLAMGNLETPLSSSSPGISKKRGQRYILTPGSGEALLRRQVKTLLQKVEEEADLSKITLKDMPFFNTPANTPQILSGNTNACLPPSLTPSPIDDKFSPIPQMSDGKKHEPENDVVITRALLLDFSDKSSDSPSKCSSVRSYQGAIVCVDDDDASSVWSIQVNASSTQDDDEEEEKEDEEEECDDDDDYEEDENDNGYGLLVLDELCEGIGNISVEEGSEFKGKHIRFVYSSDGDDETEQVFECEGESSSPVINSSGGRELPRLKGLPTPKGKHVRFPQE